MKKPEKSKVVILLQYLITTVACGIIVTIWVFAAGIMSPYQEVVRNTHWNIANETQKIYFILTNAFFGAGTITAAIGLLVVASNGGMFEMLVYGMRRFVSLFQRDPTKVKFRTFYDYHTYRSAQPRTSFVFLLVVGLVFLGISFIFLSVYMNAAPTA